MGYKFIPNPEFAGSVESSPALLGYMESRAEFIKDRALERFESMVRHTHPVTPPPYAESFYIRVDIVSHQVIVGNSDPAAFWVEFGAHPRGGPTFILGYHPLGAGLDAASDSASHHINPRINLPTRIYKK